MKNTTAFTKMHGLGNDFVIVDATKQPFALAASAIAHLANRHTGIGFDQLLIIEQSQAADFACQIFNADGSTATQCGNGLRCIGRYIHENKLHSGNTFTIQTKAGIYPLTVKNYEQITVAMGIPEILEKLIHLNLPKSKAALTASILSLGNPHAIIKVAAIDQIAGEELSAQIAALSYFSDGANVGFMQVLNPTHIRLRTFERGVGETFACGSNACAAVIAGISNQWLDDKVEVEFKYGKLTIEWHGGDQPILMSGPAARVFEGVI